MVMICGAGMAGLLAGAMFRNDSQIYEKGGSLPNNHHALLRFRSNEIANHLNIPFKSVEVIKIIHTWRNRVADAVGYSLKSGGMASMRSISSAEGKIDKRLIAPPDFIQRLEELQSHPIIYGTEVNLEFIGSFSVPVISTIPMPILMDMLGYEDKPVFNYRHGRVIRADIDIPSELCATVYYPDPALPMIRATLTGQLLQVELVENYDKDHFTIDLILERYVLPDFGLDDVSFYGELKEQGYAKITPIDERERRRFIMYATDNFNVYSLGRYAIWKPGLLLDDVYHDIIKIQNMLRETNYSGRLK